MINAVNLGLVKNGLNRRAQLVGAAKIVTERFFDNEPPPPSARGFR